ncbi:MAG: uracil-DNA glycosylase [Elusimicrobiota bacterium]
MDLKKLEKEVESCRKCPLGNYRLNPCIGEGDSRAKIMFIGEGPGFSEDHMGRVFVGRAGKLLDKIISGALKRKRSQVYITNIVKCHPMKNPSNPEKRGNDRAPNETEVRACMPYLYRQIKIINPRVIVPLGSPSTKSILKRKEGISRLRGKSYEIEIDSTKFTVVPTYHPAYLLRNNSKKAEVFEDTKLILSLL